MTAQQRTALDQMLRQAPLDLGGDVEEQRRIFAEMTSSTPLPDDVRTEQGTLGRVPVVHVSISGVEPTGTILYFHGGAYAIGSAVLAAGLASDFARRSRTRAISVDYALAPEHPYPAGVEDGVAAYRALLDTGTSASSVVLAGESAGGGLVLSVAGAILASGLPRPAAIYIASPWTDLTLTGTSMSTKAALDPALTPHGLERRARDYAADRDQADPGLSPVFAHLTGFPPMLVQVGGNEVLLDDSTRLATRAAADGVPVVLDVTPGVPHVFVGFAAVLDEADAALERAGRFIRTQLDHPTD